jgi:hypothetical protein
MYYSRSHAMRRILLILIIGTFTSNIRAAEPEQLRAAAASCLAARVANDYCKQSFGTSPFSASSGKLQFINGRWQWRALIGYGYRDLLATVSFSRSGSGGRCKSTSSTTEQDNTGESSTTPLMPTRRVTTFSMIKTLPLHLTLALGSHSRSYSC